jgi:CheY-like chemotaxis protein/predicted regulator of Ras-like GTPase activity (Roadblock/LC7/MglB family)
VGNDELAERNGRKKQSNQDRRNPVSPDPVVTTMTRKHILIVDDEKSILTVLKSSLKKVGPEYHITTASNGFAALDELRQRDFDLVVTDFNMLEMDGLELMEAIRYAQPKAKLIMITAYGNDIIEAETKRLKAFRYLTKPLEIKTFRQVVQQALSEPQLPPSALSVWANTVYRNIDTLLKQVRSEVSARAIFLTDIGGNIICKNGHTDDHPIESITSLLGGGIATLVEAGRQVDGECNTIHLAYREGKQEDIYALNVGQNHLLILLVSRGPYSSRLGSVWYHARSAAINLQDILGKADENQPAQANQIFEEAVDQAFNTELDKLFNTDELF